MEVTDYTRPITELDKKEALSRMERDWDVRAREAPEYYIATAQQQWQLDEFFRSGETNVDNDVLADADVIFRGRDAGQMRVLEIGCGAGRMTRAMAASFGEVHAVDISAEMIRLAKRNLSDLRNVFLYKNNGSDLSALPDKSCDFAFSFIVFQHIPMLEVIESYIGEVHRCLRPGAVFKFQVQGDTSVEAAGNDTWLGVPMSLDDARSLAERCGFEVLRASGQGTQYFWLWFLKPKWPWIPETIRRNAREALTLARTALDRRVVVTFVPSSVRAGESYVVRIPGFMDQIIDIGYELAAGQCAAPVTGVVCGWCKLDSQGQASILVPAEHPTGNVRITKVRARSKGSRWFRAAGAIRVAGVDEPHGR